MDACIFADFVTQLLQRCGRWPDLKSVLVMDNVSLHDSEQVGDVHENIRVKLIYLPPYSPDPNLIEEFFSELKGFIYSIWSVHGLDCSSLEILIQYCKIPWYLKLELYVQWLAVLYVYIMYG